MKVLAWLGLLFSGLVLTVLSIQYPLSATFPAGSDAASHIWITRELLAGHFSILQYSWYPLSHALFMLSAVLPLNWPMRFVWWMAMGHILTGVTLAWLAYRLYGWKSACVAMVGWAITTTTINRYFEDGTLAQLWSLPFLILFLERILSEDPIGSLVALTATFLAHPFSGIVALGAVAVALPTLWKTQRHTLTWWLTGACSLLAVAGLFLITQRFTIFFNFGSEESPFSIPDLTRSLMGPLFVLAPVGFLLLEHRTRQRQTFFFVYTAFTAISFLATFNNQAGGGLLAERFASYLVIAVTLLSALALPYLIAQVFKSRLPRYAAYTLATCAVALLSWQHSRPVYAFYEAQGNYARLHSDELAAIEWLNQNLSGDQFILSTTDAVHGTWIRSLTQFQWEPVEPATLTTGQGLPAGSTYAVFFTHADHTVGSFPVVYQNKGAVIEKLP